MTTLARHRAVLSFLVAAVLWAAGCSTSDRATTAEAPAATVPSPQPLTDEALGLTAVGAEAAPSPPGGPDTSASGPKVSPPRQVVIPSIDVDAPIIDLGLTSDGALETPTDFDLAGWWAGGTLAAEAGPTVIVGHIDDSNGPAVFFRLQELEPGDSIIVIDDLGREQAFAVVDKGLYDKTSFPTERVYGASGAPTLRLVSCGGEFDRSERSYESNWVVYAVSVTGR